MSNVGNCEWMCGVCGLCNRICNTVCSVCGTKRSRSPIRRLIPIEHEIAVQRKRMAAAQKKAAGAAWGNCSSSSVWDLPPAEPQPRLTKEQKKLSKKYPPPFPNRDKEPETWLQRDWAKFRCPKCKASIVNAEVIACGSCGTALRQDCSGAPSRVQTKRTLWNAGAEEGRANVRPFDAFRSSGEEDEVVGVGGSSAVSAEERVPGEPSAVESELTSTAATITDKEASQQIWSSVLGCHVSHLQTWSLECPPVKLVCDACGSLYDEFEKKTPVWERVISRIVQFTSRGGAGKVPQLICSGDFCEHNLLSSASIIQEIKEILDELLLPPQQLQNANFSAEAPGADSVTRRPQIDRPDDEDADESLDPSANLDALPPGLLLPPSAAPPPAIPVPHAVSEGLPPGLAIPQITTTAGAPPGIPLPQPTATAGAPPPSLATTVADAPPGIPPPQPTATAGAPPPGIPNLQTAAPRVPSPSAPPGLAAAVSPPPGLFDDDFADIEGPPPGLSLPLHHPMSSHPPASATNPRPPHRVLEVSSSSENGLGAALPDSDEESFVPVIQWEPAADDEPSVDETSAPSQKYKQAAGDQTPQQADEYCSVISAPESPTARAAFGGPASNPLEPPDPPRQRPDLPEATASNRLQNSDSTSHLRLSQRKTHDANKKRPSNVKTSKRRSSRISSAGSSASSRSVSQPSKASHRRKKAIPSSAASNRRVLGFESSDPISEDQIVEFLLHTRVLLLIGNPLAGKSQLARLLEDSLDYVVFDHTAHKRDIKDLLRGPMYKASNPRIWPRVVIEHRNVRAAQDLLDLLENERFPRHRIGCLYIFPGERILRRRYMDVYTMRKEEAQIELEKSLENSHIGILKRELRREQFLVMPTQKDITFMEDVIQQFHQLMRLSRGFK
eukprot:Gregarina_sp_Pseudo_9__3539@NODE_36_length_5412_cov_61_930207_g33_i0_p1_GENE_NODE_36_length_5412_cov_61_930207_g33_i0NODE_36_length_5412_cov_61_930207_g33_i0_p1_ORF_typecomplete_len899_score140_51AAA_33/PF13671_6/0_00089zfribbon_3/PF13248_6/5_2e02zfribbon_3/PF13248_6/0_011zfribbon_3/PF13248_6/2_8e03ATP_bind_2/PF03668_15/0_19zinc_ribbon_2/PF13240_6/85zinc_ribbon_2/PF13240_6/2_1zincribbon_6/PF10005_9/1_1e02zincribbon_6/PF10005_9/3_8_NODE_36_length_5412_cov_61_930207_g33_i0522748